MPASNATIGFGCLFKRGDGGVGAGTQASRTIGTSNQQIVIKARKAGTAGNSKTCAIIVSGNNTPFSFTVTASALTINSATDGSGLATTTVLQAIEQLVQDATFVDNWVASKGAGNGSGVLVAGASQALTGGTNGAEVFTTVGEILDFDIPGLRTALAEITHMTSPDGVREYLPTLHDVPEITIPMNLVPSDAQQDGIRSDQTNRVKRNWQIVLTDSGLETVTFTAYVVGFQPRAAKEEALRVDVTLKPTGPATWSGDV